MKTYLIKGSSRNFKCIWLGGSDTVVMNSVSRTSTRWFKRTIKKLQKKEQKMNYKSQFHFTDETKSPVEVFINDIVSDVVNTILNHKDFNHKELVLELNDHRGQSLGFKGQFRGIKENMKDHINDVVEIMNSVEDWD